MSKSDSTINDAALLAAFVAAFPWLDGLTGYEWDIPPQMLDRAAMRWTHEAIWRPIAVETSPNNLDKLYQELSQFSPLPVKFPALYERLLLTYRWLRVDLGECRLLGSAPAEGGSFDPLLQEIRSDRGLFDALLPAGYAQFAFGGDLDYDPVCFDLTRASGGDCPIVKIDHEQILCFYRVRVVGQLAGSFRELVGRIVEQAQIKS